MFKSPIFKKAMAEIAQGIMFSKGSIKVESNGKDPVFKPFGYDDLMRDMRKYQKCCNESRNDEVKDGPCGV